MIVVRFPEQTHQISAFHANSYVYVIIIGGLFSEVNAAGA
jgi:hypothetical protein